MNALDWTPIQKRNQRFPDPRFPFAVAHCNERAVNMKCCHWHDFLEISRVCGGEGVYHIEDKTIPVQQGDLVIINNIERHRVEYGESAPLFETVLHFGPALLESLSGGAPRLFDYSASRFTNKLRLSPPVAAEANGLVDSMTREYQAKEPYYQLNISGSLARFIALALRDDNSRTLDRQQLALHGKNIARLEQVLRYLSAHLEAETTLARTARHFYLNPAYFSEYFRRNLGVTFSVYLRELRIGKAMQMLESDAERSVADIAFACGFSSLSAFYDSFSKVAGTAPQRWAAQKIRNLNQ